MNAKKALVIGITMGMAFSASADTGGDHDYKNNYIMTGITLSGEHEKTFQGINLEYNTVDYTSHWSGAKHTIGGYGIHLNTSETKFENRFDNVRELSLYKKVGFELQEETNIYHLFSLGAGVFETSIDKEKSEDSNKDDSSDNNSGEQTTGADNHTPAFDEEDGLGIDEGDSNNDDANNDDSSNDDSSNSDQDVTTGNPNTNENINLKGEISTGIGYFSRDGQYAFSAEAVGTYYASEGFEPGLRVMFGWRF